MAVGWRGDLQWFCLRVAQQKEQIAERLLRENGYHAFCPTEIKWKRRHRRMMRREPVTYPLLIRYIFLGWPQGQAVPWLEIFRFRVVLSVVGQSGQPLAIPAAQMQRVFVASQEPIAYKRSVNPHRSLRVGDNVEVIGGGFAGHMTQLTEVRGKTGRIILELLGAVREIEVPLEYLEVA